VQFVLETKREQAAGEGRTERRERNGDQEHSAIVSKVVIKKRLSWSFSNYTYRLGWHNPEAKVEDAPENGAGVFRLAEIALALMCVNPIARHAG